MKSQKRRFRVWVVMRLFGFASSIALLSEIQAESWIGMRGRAWRLPILRWELIFPMSSGWRSGRTEGQCWTRWRSICEYGHFKVILRVHARTMTDLITETDTSHVIKTIPGRHASTMNDQNLQLALKWIKGCTRSHPICKEFQPRQSNWRPSRLI